MTSLLEAWKRVRLEDDDHDEEKSSKPKGAIPAPNNVNELYAWLL